jgi:YegS/Rv2252/BmrU family lipid kinase
LATKDTKTIVIINPISGTGGRPDAARGRAERAAAFLRDRGVDGQVFVTERPGHARELTRAFLAAGVSTVIAWGGDGTVNEVGSALAFQGASLAIVPSGSGNGLARELHIPWEPDAALQVALTGDERTIDAGELDGRLFFNVAGIGLDARVSYRFAEDGLVHRGFHRYLAITGRELFRYKPVDQTIVLDGAVLHARTLLVAIANGRQYGNGALIAPTARVDDGRLDVVVVDYRPGWRAILQIPRLFMGEIARVPGVTIRSAVDIEVTSKSHVLYHVDGEPAIGSVSLKARVRPRALRIKVPPGSGIRPR